MNRIIKLIAAVMALFSAAALPASASAGLPGGTGLPGEGMDISACVLTDASGNTRLVAAGADEKLPAAGLTKLAALAVVCEAFDDGIIEKDAVLTVSEAASRIGGTTAFLRQEENISAENLLKAAVMINAGDALHTLASAAFGGEGAAVDAINSRLASLGIDAVFGDITGKNTLFSAAELARLAGALAASETFLEYGAKYYDTIPHENAGQTELANPNKLVRRYSGCIGAGTGSSAEAGYCGAFAAKRGGTLLIAVVLGAKDSEARFSAGVALLDHGFSAYRSVHIASEGDEAAVLPVKNSLTRSVSAVYASDIDALIRTSHAEYTLESELPDALTPPFEKGDIIGRMIVRGADGTILAVSELAASSGAEEAKYRDCFRLIIAAFARGFGKKAAAGESACAVAESRLICYNKIGGACG